MRIDYNEYVYVVEKDGACKVVVGAMELKSFDLDKLLLKIIEKDPKLFRKRVWKPIADRYSYPIGSLTEGKTQGGMKSNLKKSAHANYLRPPPPPTIYKEGPEPF